MHTKLFDVFFLKNPQKKYPNILAESRVPRVLFLRVSMTMTFLTTYIVLRFSAENPANIRTFSITKK